ncbi:MAG: methylated-DNA--[protein]-cysteine S-methyltransferase [Dehalococcoidia bacterium]
MDRCFTSEELTAVLLGEPEKVSRDELEIHAEGCPSCLVELSEALALNRQLGDAAFEPTPAPDSLRSSIDELVANFGEVQVPWGSVQAAVTSRGLTRLEFDASAQRMAELLAGDGLIPEESPRALQPLRDDLERYFAGESKDFATQPDLRTHNKFMRQVLERTYRIPAGSYSTYMGVATEIGKPRAYRAVGNALGANPIPIIIPCHRVLATSGGLGGYGGGLQIKRFLLELEGAMLSPRARAALP